MRIGLLTEGGYPYVNGDAALWCDRLVRGLGRHEFDLYALSRSEHQESGGRVDLPPQVGRVRTAPLWTAPDDGVVYGRRARRRFTEYYGHLVAALCEGRPADFGRSRSAAEADRFGYALYGLAELARDEAGLVGALRSEYAVRALERACRAPGALRTAREARVPELLAVAAHLERALRPLSLDWYEDAADTGLGAVDLCHATSGGAAALPGLLARHFFDVPLVVTEYGVRLRTHYLAPDAASVPDARAGSGSRVGAGSGPDTGPDAGSGLTAADAPAVRALLAAFHGRLAAEVYLKAACVTPGNAHTRRWQERCGADRAKLRTVYPGMDATRFAAAAEAAEADADGVSAGDAGESARGGGGVGDAGGVGGVGASVRGAGPDVLVWVGRVEPAKDLVSLLHAFAEVRRAAPGTRLRIVGTPAGPEGAAYLGHCRMLAAQLFPDEAAGPHAVGENPVSFEEIGGPEAPTPADAYAESSVVVLSSVVEGFPVGLVEAMFCGRATVSTDVGAVVEVVGGTGLVVPPRNPRALAEACVALLRDPERRARLGAAARARALELFSVEQNIAAFHSIYLDVVARSPVRRVLVDAAGEPRPFAVPTEAWLPGRWTRLGGRTSPWRGPDGPGGTGPREAAGPAVVTEGAR